MNTSHWSLHTHGETPSTQDLAIAAAIAGAPGRQAFLAASQTAGRGRQDRAWQSHEGNFYFSALLRPGAIAPSPAFWSLMAGVALHEAVAAFTADAPLTLKWPNDLLLGGAKVAGVLIDSAMTADGVLDWVVIGAGINLAHAPALPGRPTACLADYGVHVTPPEMAERLMAAIEQWAARDLPTIRAGWLARAHPPGTLLRVQQGARVIEGAFEGLDGNGALKLHGQSAIITGEVSEVSSQDTTNGGLEALPPAGSPLPGMGAEPLALRRKRNPHAAGG